MVKNLYLRPKISCLNKIGRLISEKRKATFWNGFLAYIDSLLLVLEITALLRLKRTLEVGRFLSFDDIEDPLMVTILGGIPILYSFVAVKMWLNHGKLAEKDSTEV